MTHQNKHPQPAKMRRKKSQAQKSYDNSSPKDTNSRHFMNMLNRYP